MALLKKNLRGRLALAIGAALALLATASVAPAGSSIGEYEVKAAYLLNFARLVEWPSSAFGSPAEPIVLGTYGRDFFGDALERLVDGRAVGQRKVRVRRITRTEDLRDCHIAFISSSKASSLPEILAAVRDVNVLLVGESEGFARSGGAINFFIQEGKVRFAVNRKAAEDAGLKISSRMLRIATLVSESVSSPVLPIPRKPALELGAVPPASPPPATTILAAPMVRIEPHRSPAL